MPLYSENFPVATFVRIAGEEKLADFKENWRHHHPLTERQLAYAGQIAEVLEVSFYHGGDVLYVLKDVPGIWHEECLQVFD